MGKRDGLAEGGALGGDRRGQETWILRGEKERVGVGESSREPTRESVAGEFL